MRFDVRTFVVGLALSLLTGQLVGTASADVVVDNPVHYVALGDSRAAGPAWLSYAGGDGCGRSDAAYPAMIASALHPASFASVACSGATSAHVVSTPQSTYTPLPRRVPVQIDALRPHTTLVTLSIGGNDLNWAQLIGPCLQPVPQEDPRCRNNPLVLQAIDQRLGQLGPVLDGVLAAITQRSPHAVVVLVGHSGYFDHQGCFPDSNLHGADAAFVQDFFVRFDSVLRDSAGRHGATFVDVAGPAVGHDACAPIAERWFTGSMTFGPTPFLHPTPLGSAAMAGLVLDAIGR
ncbi:SGNH/GDSL hydrolase family protein [Rhodococcus fascians]|nr:SGNH/GDSL hydrolase family protein [Rhodococcus fascians]MBY4137611.1 SGNH/GDSL hydrolase family protein [Rhodococcus fascians]MBY4215530.1 SGNH/GDSL hydrolase family protein [Rhodococcus fascians]MBY4222687.1 SGNH/GDSL hydrolase family protein [Rhodococcus fascians]MBY4233154.1 SGNH/GDSL hydrolase family protein [Rhodococcus fascians]